MLKNSKIVSTLILAIFACLMLSCHAVMGYHAPRRDRQVAIYSDANYRGAFQVLKAGWYNIDELRIGNDTLSSLMVPTGWQVTLYEHGNYQGRSKTFTADCRYVGNDFNDRTSSIRVAKVNSLPAVPAPPHNKYYVSIYSDANYRGAVQVLEAGWYNITALRIGNDTLSSLRIPAGWRVTLYEHRNYQGRSKTFTADCRYVGNDFNDRTSSIRVARVHSIPPPQYNHQVSIYSNAYYRGAVQVLKEGWYNIDRLRIGNNTLSSLRIPAGWRVTLYEHRDYRGRSKTFTADCRYVGNDFNNRTSSIHVEYIGKRFDRRRRRH